MNLDPATTVGALAAGASRVTPEGVLSQGRFLPGTLVAKRYRVIGLIGQGGMGEVYRADDLKLGQAVALKFLPERLEKDPARLSQLLNEVKIARQVSHANVCRVYDVSETDGRHFISMEFVDGEDLAALLRRIGHLPREKAIQIARQLCAGLAAAHEQGVLHRDLKPANVMIDGRGRARITDFGLARFAGGSEDGGSRAGTPAYMAPELLAGMEATVRSDLYALGLVLYELFTGRTAFKADTPAGVQRMQRETPPPSPSEVIRGFDPIVEGIILRCMEAEPRNRPTSALSVAAALPGGDPLAAALAAGETPSPELLAEAGTVGGLRPAAAAICLAVLAMALPLVVVLSPRAELIGIVPLPKPPEYLSERAREIVRRIGYAGAAKDWTTGFDYDPGAVGRLLELDPTSRRWTELAGDVPGLIYFWYRESPMYLSPVNDLARSPSYDDPPPTLAGMIGVQIDPAGNLRRFEAIPPPRDASEGAGIETDWSRCFVEAGLEIATFRRVDPSWTPAVYADSRAAWEGTYAGRPGAPIRIEAAAYHGRPVSFRILDTWNRPTETEAGEGLWVRSSQVVSVVVFVAVLVGGTVLARRNSRLGRGDRRGATCLALFVMISDYGAWLLKGHHVWARSELWHLFVEMSLPVLAGFVVWTFYMALEPYMRRLWPRMVVSWVRFLGGRFRDPLVGRDVLIGVSAGALLALVDRAYAMTPRWLALPAPRPDLNGPRLAFMLISLRGLRYSLGNLLGSEGWTLFVPLLLMVLLLLLRMLLRRQALAIAAFLALQAFFGDPGGANSYLYIGANLLFTSILVTLVFRFGLLTLVMASAVGTFLTYYPLTPDATSWYVGNTVLVMLVVIALAVYGLRVSLAGRPILHDAVLEP